MEHSTASAFALPERLAHKSDPALIAVDERHFTLLASSLGGQVRALGSRLDALRRERGVDGQEAMDRDLEIHRLSARLKLLERFGLDLCLGRMVYDGAAAPIYIGRMGLTDETGGQLLVDWRAPAAEPFFAATTAHPMGLVSRRRYRWNRGLIADYWDEVLRLDVDAPRDVALDDDSAFIASLGSSRSPRMRDVLATIAADQDAIIRAGSRGALVVDGGPGTGKTVVALHRTAYLQYADPRVAQRHGGVLFVGPSRAYLDYIADVLPGLGEEGVRTCILSDLVAAGADAAAEQDPRVAQLKASARMVDAIDAAVRFHEEPPTEPMVISTPWSDIELRPADWDAAFAAPDPGTLHNEAIAQVLAELVEILVARYGPIDDRPGQTPMKGSDDIDDPLTAEALRAVLQRHPDLRTAVHRAWPTIEAAELVEDLWSVPAYLRLCAPWLDADEVRLLRRAPGQPWTDADLPLLDAARHRLGDPDAHRRRVRREEELAAAREEMDAVIGHLIDSDDTDMMVMSMLRGEDLRSVLDDPAGLVTSKAEELAGPFAHIVVDEAQELTDAQWRMLMRRCPSGSFTVVGDRAQARRGFRESWRERLGRVGIRRVELAPLSINYRTPKEVMAAAEPAIREVLPDANVPTSIRSSGVPVRYGSADELGDILRGWQDEHTDGIACVIGAPWFEATPRVSSASPELAKGLEFDLVVLVDPESFGTGIQGAVDRYVAMTRATQQLVILTTP